MSSRKMQTVETESITHSGPVAYSYARYSSRKQAIGSSEERQVDQARDWANRRGLRLVEEVFDRGKSGYHGDHRKRGAFGRFLGDLKAGRVPQGSFLVIEAMNRLSRETPYDAQGILRELLDGEIVLVVLYRNETEIDRDRVRKDPRVLADLHQDIEIAHQQSKEKAEMADRNWSRLAKLIGEKVAVTRRCPGWLHVVGEERKYGKIFKHGRYERHPENWPIVEEIIKLRTAGSGLTKIASKLNQRGIRPFQDVYKGKKTSGWTDSSLKFILRHPALYGEYRFQRKVDGVLPEPVEDYYPAVLSKGDWLLLQKKLDGARKTGGGRRIRKVPNLLDGLLRCGLCGGPMNISGDGPSCNYQYRRYACDHSRRNVKKENLPEGRCSNRTSFQVPLVEGLVLYNLFARLTKEDLLSERPPESPLVAEVKELEAELAEVEEKVERANRRLLDEADDRRYQRLQDLLDQEEAKAVKLRARLRDAEQALTAAKHSPTPADQWEKTRQLISSLQESGASSDEVREKLQRALHDLIEEINVSPKPIPSYRTSDGISLKLVGSGKRIPRFPFCHIILKGDKILLTGEPPSALWQTQVMGLELPDTPRHLRAKIQKSKKALADEAAPSTSDPGTTALMESLKTVFQDEHQLKSVDPMEPKELKD